MTKIKQKFFNWFGKSLDQVDVADWDEKVTTDPEFQKAIREDSDVQLCYSISNQKWLINMQKL